MSPDHPNQLNRPVGKVENKLLHPTMGPLFDKSASGFSIGAALEWASTELQNFSPEQARIETRALLSGLLDLSPTHLHIQRDVELSVTAYDTFIEAVRRRKSREPVAYILGKKNFRGWEIEVNPSVLIPRPETELLVEKGLDLLRATQAPSPAVLDMGTGSGCIAVSLAKDMESLRVWASDVSPEALEVAQRNAQSLNVNERIQFFSSDLYSAFGTKWKGYFDMILSNPPYISSSKLSLLEPDLGFEPQLALDGGPMGLAVLEKLIPGSRTYLKPAGLLLLEIGFDQGESVRRMMVRADFKKVEIIKDLNQLDRIAIGSVDGSI